MEGLLRALAENDKPKIISSGELIANMQAFIARASDVRGAMRNGLAMPARRESKGRKAIPAWVTTAEFEAYDADLRQLVDMAAKMQPLITAMGTKRVDITQRLKNHRRIKASVDAIHCTHCTGKGGDCVCKACPRPTMAQCVVRHCTHCAGMSGKCACKSQCARPDRTHCNPREAKKQDAVQDATKSE
jgi:hypothetical protein